MHGIENDYIFVDCFIQNAPDNIENIAISLSHRHTGISADGIVLILPSDLATCRMRMFNADGSEGNMCGNAIRCVGKYAYENNITKEKQLTVETKSGIKTLWLQTDDNNIVQTVSVDMGKAEFAVDKIPMKHTEETFIGCKITINNTIYHNATALSMGNPHLVIVSKNIDILNLNQMGKHFENHIAFPERVNTEFAELSGDNTIRMRVWERGSGETMACGTGACAVAAAFAELGLVDRNQAIKVILRGGELSITYKPDRTVIMQGTATEVFRGSVNI